MNVRELQTPEESIIIELYPLETPTEEQRAVVFVKTNLVTFENTNKNFCRIENEFQGKNK